MIGHYDADGSIVVREARSEIETRVPVGDLRIGFLRVDPAGKALVAAALEPKGRTPNLLGGTATHGDFRLFVTNIATPSWQRLDKGISLDPVWFPGSDRIAYASNTGPAIADLRSGEIKRKKLGRFAWGAPSMSVNEVGTRVAFIKWRGDAQMIGAWDLATDAVTIYRASCYRYSWWDPDTVVFQLGSDPKLLDVRTGKIKRWATLTTLVEAARSVARDELAAVPVGWSEWSGTQPQIGAPLVQGDRVYFAVGYAFPDPKGHLGYSRRRGFFSVNRKASDPACHGWFEAEAPWEFSLVGDGLFWAYWSATPATPSKTAFFGPSAGAIQGEWWPLPRHPQPEFGTHFFS